MTTTAVQGGGGEAPIGVFLQGVEVDGITGRELESLGADHDFQFPFDEIKQFGAGVVMGRGAGFGDGVKVGQISVKLPFVGAKVEALKVPGNGCAARIRGEALALAAARNGDDVALAWVGEEVIEPDVKDHGDANEGGESGDETPIFKARQHGRGKAGMGR